MPQVSGPKGSTKLAVGSLVLIQDHLTPRMKWPLGIITQVFPSKKDGIIRTVEVKVMNGVLTRSVPRIHDLEFMCDIADQEPQPLSVAGSVTAHPDPAVTESAAEGMEPEPQVIPAAAESVAAPPAAAASGSAAEGLQIGAQVSNEPEANVYKTRSGRTVKRPEKLNE